MSNTNLKQVKTLVDNAIQDYNQKESELFSKRDELYSSLLNIDNSSFDLDEIKKSEIIKQDIDVVKQALKNLQAQKQQTILNLDLYSKVKQAIENDDKAYTATKDDKITRLIDEVSDKVSKLIAELYTNDTLESKETSEIMGYLASLKAFDPTDYGVKRTFDYGSIDKIIYLMSKKIRNVSLSTKNNLSKK